MPVEEQVCVLYAGVKGYLDKINTSDIGKFEKMYLDTIHSKHAGLLETIRKEGALSQ
jgi:F-type H+/Na+-transporting ATPase subunit alpha